MPNLKSVAYFVQWAIYGRNHKVQDVPAHLLTHILYSFANVRPETGEVYLTDTWADTDIHFQNDSWNETGLNLYGNCKQLYLVKKRNRKLKTLLSIGGWTYSANFPQAASTAGNREKFASSAVQLVKDLGFDGVDIDWEYPADNIQAQNFVELLRETRRQLDAYQAQYALGNKMLLTIAAPCGSQHYAKLLMSQMDPFLDFWNLMAYDFSGSWDGNAGHQSNLYRSYVNPRSTPFAADEAVAAYIGGGVAPSKLVLGMPIYGRGFTNTDGPGQVFSGVGTGSWEPGVWDYKVLPQPGAVETHDTSLGASWSYDAGSRTIVSYDTPTIQAQKAQYILSKELGGAMWWETSSDKPVASGASLIQTMVDTFGGPSNLDSSENTLAYAGSKYANIQNQMGTEI